MPANTFPPPSSAPGARLLSWAALGLVLAAALGVRYGFVEPAEIAHLCDPGTGPWWCPARRVMIDAFYLQALGWASVAFALASLFSRAQWVAWSAVAFGVAGMTLWGWDLAAPGLLVGALRLARLQAGTPAGEPRQEHSGAQGSA